MFESRVNKAVIIKLFALDVDVVVPVVRDVPEPDPELLLDETSYVKEPP